MWLPCDRCMTYYQTSNKDWFALRGVCWCFFSESTTERSSRKHQFQTLKGMCMSSTALSLTGVYPILFRCYSVKLLDSTRNWKHIHDTEKIQQSLSQIYDINVQFQQCFSDSHWWLLWYIFCAAIFYHKRAWVCFSYLLCPHHLQNNIFKKESQKVFVMYSLF